MITTSLDYTIEKSKDNYNVLKVNRNNKWVYIGSKYSMESSVKRFIDDIILEKEINKKIFFVYGFGTGEHIKSLCEKFQNNRIIVFEPNEQLGSYISNLKWINDYKNLTVLCSEEDHLKNFLRAELKDFKTDKIKVSYFANYDKIYGKEFSQLLEIIKKLIWDIQIEINTSMSYSKKWFDTFTSNFKYIVEGVPSTAYKDKYKGKPAIIVSAGPSLEKNIDELKKVKDDFLILVGGRTLRSVLQKGIKPSIIVNVDPSERNYQLVKGYIEDTNIPLLFYEGTNDNIVKNHNGKKIFFTQKDFIKKMAEVEIENYTFGGSIAHIATGFAEDIGCSPIIFIGQDLAFTGEKMYSAISADQNNPNTANAKKGTGDLMVEAVGGGMVRTEPVLYGFKKNLETFISAKKQNTLFINATEGGARIEGTIEMPLKSVIESYGGNQVKSFEDMDIEYNVDIKENAKKIISEAAKSSKNITKLCEKACKNISDLFQHYNTTNDNKVNTILMKLERIDEKIRKEYEQLEMTESLIYPLVFDAMTSSFDLEHSGNIKKEENIETILKTNKRFYLNLSANMKYAMKALRKIELYLNDETELEHIVKGLNL